MTKKHQKKTHESELWTSLLRALVIPTKFGVLFLVIPTKFGVLFLSLVLNLAVQLLFFKKRP